MEKIKSPFPWAGGKSRIADEVWKRFGDPKNYVEPFFGSGAVFFGRPGFGTIETINDKDGFIVNFFRAVQRDPIEVAKWAQNPPFEADLHARHYWLVERKKELIYLLQGQPDFYDAQVAGWWVWGMSLWIGSDFCIGIGSWFVKDGKLTYMDQSTGIQTKGISKKIVALGRIGNGIRGKSGEGDKIYRWFEAVATRLSDVRITCGDWKRTISPSATHSLAPTAVFLDPPYSLESGRYGPCIYATDDLSVAHEAREYCIANGNNPLLKIALCGYTGEHDELADHGWSPYFWTANGGMANISKKRTNENRHREVVWFSPHCNNPSRLVLNDD